jgi:hypothetical protein
MVACLVCAAGSPAVGRPAGVDVTGKTAGTLPRPLAAGTTIDRLRPVLPRFELRAGPDGEAERNDVYRMDGMNWRERLAVDFMAARLKTQYPVGRFQIDVRPDLQQNPGNPLRPITGIRPVAVVAKISLSKGGSTFFERLFHALNPKSHVKDYVVVEKKKLPAVLDASESMTAVARAYRAFPIAEKLRDMAASKGFRHGLVTAGVGSLAAFTAGTVGVVAGLGAVAYAAIEMSKGLQRREAARLEAVKATAEWARESIKEGMTPTLAESFSTYKDILSKQNFGTYDGGLEKFADRLASEGL